MKLKTKAYIFAGKVLYVLLYPALKLNSTTRTRGLIINEMGEILLVKNWISEGDYYLPGGGIHRNESLTACLSREVFEETGIRVREASWRFVTEHKNRFTRLVYFTSSVRSKPMKRQALEITDAAWFRSNDLPKKHDRFIDQLLKMI